MQRILTGIFLLMVAYASADFSDVWLCSNGIENDDDDGQSLNNPLVCMPFPSTDASLEDMPQIRRKRSTEDAANSWETPRLNRAREIINIHLPSSFTPRLGRRRSTDRMVKKTKHIINLNAGNAFTPRLGRRMQSSEMN